MRRHSKVTIERVILVSLFFFTCTIFVFFVFFFQFIKIRGG